jgi:hypothetical protein
MDDHTESDEKILTFDVPDEALERAASAERQAFTWVYCTLKRGTGTTAAGRSSVQRASSGSLAIFAAILRASSLLSNLTAERRPGQSGCQNLAPLPQVCPTNQL